MGGGQGYTSSLPLLFDANQRGKKENSGRPTRERQGREEKGRDDNTFIPPLPAS